MAGKSIFDKLWERHLITGEEGQPQLMYVDQHYIHEVTSPQAFQGLRDAGRKVRRPDLTFGTFDHNVPTVNIYDIRDVISKAQIDKLSENVKDFGIEHAAHGSELQGIVHMVGPETGKTQPGKFIVCGDSHTATHGAFGAIAFGIGTSEVEHVFATQTIWQVKPKKMLVKFTGVPPRGVYSKDFILALIARYGVAAGVGHVVEYAGDAIEHLTMEERMTICNMSIEFGAAFPEIRDMNDERAYNYMDLSPGKKAEDIDLGYIFIGSCTNARLSDLQLAAKFVAGKHIAPNLTAIVVPGSRPVKRAAEKMGLDKIFMDAGFEWRDPGCSMCLGMNPDKVPDGVHCASTSNRNFEDRQGFGAKTHLCSPAMAAAAAIAGRFVDVRQLPEVQ